MLLLIDGDILVYRSACAAQKQYYYAVDGEGNEIRYPVGTKKKNIKVDDGWELKLDYIPEDVSHALYNVKNTIGRIKKQAEEHFNQPMLTRIYLTSDDKSNFRFELATSKGYKANRTSPKPIHYEAVRTYLKEKYGAHLIVNQEADDALGIAQCANLNDSVIASIDKDMKMIPGNHYNFVTGEFSYQDELQAASAFYSQLLTGDTTDNIPGLPGIGPKKASHILTPSGSDLPRDKKAYIKWMEEAVIKTYGEWAQKTYGVVSTDDSHSREEAYRRFGKDYLLEQGNLLWIRRKPNQTWSPGVLYEETETDSKASSQ